MSKQFKAGDKVRALETDPDNQITKGKEYTVKRFHSRHGLIYIDTDHPRMLSGGVFARRFELVPPAKFCTTAFYLDDEGRASGVTQFFDTEQAARDYVKEHGNPLYVYVLSRCTLVESLRVVEQTTVTRTVVTA